MFFDIKAELPKTKFQAARFVKLVQDAIAEEVSVEAKANVDKTIATWNHKPSVVVEVTARGARIMVGSVQAGRKKKPIWKYLDEGTAHRYATMTPGFRSKTRPGYLVSYAGAGHKAYVNTKIDRGPIEARGWSQKIRERGQKSIRAGIRDAVRKGLLNT